MRDTATAGETSSPVTAPGTMRAVGQDGYGSADVLQLAQIAIPEPADNKVLLRVHAAGLDRGTWLDDGPAVPAAAGDRSAFGPGGRGVRDRPRVLRRVHRGPREQARPHAGQHHVCASRRRPGLGLTALQGLRAAGRIRPGQMVLISGASGAVAATPCSWPRRSGRTSPACVQHVEGRVGALPRADHVLD